MTTIHMCISVRGMLAWNRTETKRNLRNITKSDGSRFASVEEFRDMLMDELTRGREVLPMGPACEGFDYKTGCPGHEQEANYGEYIDSKIDEWRETGERPNVLPYRGRA